MQKTRKRNIIQISILVIAVAFIAIGIFRGEPADMLRRTITVCLECIGIG